MARTNDATVRHAPQTEIGLFMRTSPFARKNPVTIADQQQIDVLQPETDDQLMCQPVQRTDRNPFIVR